MPTLKAPRSFVLPREMARQPKRSFLSLYPALRLATVVAALAFVVLFAGDLLISRSGGRGAPQSVPAAAPAPVMMQAPAAPREAAPTQEPAAAKHVSGEATLPSQLPAPAAGAAADMSDTISMTESAALSMPTATPAVTAPASNQAQLLRSAKPESSQPASGQPAAPASEQSAAVNLVEVTPAIEPLRIIEITLLVLAIVLGIAALAARRKQA